MDHVILQLFGLAQIGHLLIKLVQKFIKKIQQFTNKLRKTPDEESINKIRNEILGIDESALQNEQQALADRLNANIKVPKPSEINNRIDQLRKLYKGQMSIKQAVLQKKILNNYAEQLETLAEYGVDTQLEMTANTIFQSTQEIDSAITDFSTAIKSGDIQTISVTGENLEKIVLSNDKMIITIDKDINSISRSFEDNLSEQIVQKLDAANVEIKEMTEVEEELKSKTISVTREY